MDNLQYGERTTRKRHTCWHCREPIAIGERAHYQVNADEGQVYTIYMHHECHAACRRCDAYWHAGDCTGGECRRGQEAP